MTFSAAGAGVEPVRPTRLTNRERQVAALVCRGLANKDIARVLSVSEGTAKIHVHNIFQKLGVRKRWALISTLSGHVKP